MTTLSSPLAVLKDGLLPAPVPGPTCDEYLTHGDLSSTGFEAKYRNYINKGESYNTGDQLPCERSPEHRFKPEYYDQ